MFNAELNNLSHTSFLLANKGAQGAMIKKTKFSGELVIESEKSTPGDSDNIQGSLVIQVEEVKQFNDYQIIMFLIIIINR